MTPVSDKIPEFKKKVASFISKEDGKISKESLIKAGVLAATFSLATALASKPASSHASCEPAQCPDLPKGVTSPIGGGGGHDSHESSGPVSAHDNDLDLDYDEGVARGTHGHCAHACHGAHTSHGSHASHGSHGSHGQW